MRFGTSITARNFSHTTAKGLYQWEAGMLRHIGKALDGRLALITVDDQTGHAVFGTIRGVQAAHSVNYNVVVEHEGGQRTAYFMPNFGPILTIENAGEKGAKWVAMESYTAEKSAAIRKAKEEHPECSYGKWEATPGPYDGEVFVNFTPQKEDGGPRWYGTVHV